MGYKPLFGYSDMIQQPDGTYRYARRDIGTSPMAQAKLILRRYEDLGVQQKSTDVIVLQNVLRSVLEESDRRLFESIPWYDPIISKLIRWLR